jgi:DNA-binding MarR family transcriptional regulator
MNEDVHLASIKIARLYQRMNKQLDKKLADIDLRRGQHSTLLAISDIQSASLTELASRLEVDKAAVTRSVMSLKKKGYLNVAFAEGNKKTREVTLSDTGKQQVMQIRKALMSVEAWLEGEISSELLVALKAERL